MNARFRSVRCLLLFLLALAWALSIPVARAGQQPGKKVAILPFALNAPSQMGYLVNGIRVMLGSRLAAGGGVTVLEGAAVEPALAAAKPLRQPADYRRLGRAVQADYLIAGSLTSLGGGVSLDAMVYNVKDGGPPQRFFVTAPKESEVIPAIDRLARQIGAKVLGQQVAAPTASPAAVPPAAVSQPQPAYTSAHPDRALWGAGGMAGSPFIRPMGVSGLFGFRKSQNLPIGLRAMDVGDVDGDGQLEFVLAGANRVHIYKRQQNRFQQIGQAVTPTRYVIHYLSVADLNHNGRAEIYVSAADPSEPESFALEWDGKKFVRILNKQRWYLRVVRLPRQGQVLAGQKAGIDTFLTRGVFQLRQVKGELKQGKEIRLPRGINLFDFTFADINADKIPEIVAISQNDRLMVFSRSGKRLWVSDEYFGGTTRYLGGTDYEDQSAYDEHQVPDARIYVPARIVVRDINQDGQLDVIVNKNLSAASRVLAHLHSYPSGEMHALTWNGIAMTELWRTRKIDGYIADYQMGPDTKLPPAKGKGEPRPGAELYVGVVLRSGGLNVLAASDSTVLIYPVAYLNPEETP